MAADEDFKPPPPPREYLHRGDHVLVTPRSPSAAARAPAPEAIGSYSHRALEARAWATRSARQRATRSSAAPAMISGGQTWAPTRGLAANRAPLAPPAGFDWVRRRS